MITPPKLHHAVGHDLTEEDRRAFLTGYDFLLIDLRGATGVDFPRVLGRWLGYVDANPEAGKALAALEARADMAAWFANLESTAGPLIGAGSLGSVDLPWSFDPTIYLAERVGLLRRFARGDLNAHNFTVRFMYERSGDNSPDATVQRIVAKIVEPAFRELREWLRVRLTEAPVAPVATAPASDRTVRLDHNSPEYVQARNALIEVQEAARGANDFPDPDQKEQILAELAGGRQMFEAPLLRPAVVSVVLGGALGVLIVLFPAVGLSVLANAAWELIKRCIELAAGED